MSVIPASFRSLDRRVAACWFALCVLLLQDATRPAVAFDYAQLEFGLEVPAEIRSRFGDGFVHLLPDDILLAQTGFLAFLPDGIDVQAYASDIASGEILLAVTGHTGWPGAAIVHPSQIIDLAGQVHLDLLSDLGLPGNVEVDAVTLASDGSIEFSADRFFRFQNQTYSPADLLHFDGASLHRRFDAEAAGVPAGVNLDAAHRLLRGQSSGLLLLSFDVAVQANGITVEDEDLALATDSLLLGLAEDLDDRFPDEIESGNDLEFVSVVAQFPGFVVLTGPEFVVEGPGAEIIVQITRLYGSQGSLSLGLSVTPGAAGHPLAAMPGIDYLDPVDQATWNAGETNVARQISIPVVDNQDAMGDRALSIQPSLAPGVEWLGPPLVVVIREDDFTPDVFRDGFEAGPSAP